MNLESEEQVNKDESQAKENNNKDNLITINIETKAVETSVFKESSVPILNNTEIKEKEEENYINQIKFGELLFSLNDKQNNFFNNTVDVENSEEQQRKKYENIVSIDNALKAIMQLKEESMEYLQKVMESNDKLGATLSKVKEVEEEC